MSKFLSIVVLKKTDYIVTVLLLAVEKDVISSMRYIVNAQITFPSVHL